MVDEGGVAGAEFESGAGGGVGVVDGAGVELSSGVDGADGAAVLLSGAGAAAGAGVVTGAAAEPEAVSVTPSTPNFSRSARKRCSIWTRETSK